MVQGTSQPRTARSARGQQVGWGCWGCGSPPLRRTRQPSWPGSTRSRAASGRSSQGRLEEDRTLLRAVPEGESPLGRARVLALLAEIELTWGAFSATRRAIEEFHRVLPEESSSPLEFVPVQQMRIRLACAEGRAQEAATRALTILDQRRPWMNLKSAVHWGVLWAAAETEARPRAGNRAARLRPAPRRLRRGRAAPVRPRGTPAAHDACPDRGESGRGRRPLALGRSCRPPYRRAYRTRPVAGRYRRVRPGTGPPSSASSTWARPTTWPNSAGPARWSTTSPESGRPAAFPRHGPVRHRKRRSLPRPPARWPPSLPVRGRCSGWSSADAPTGRSPARSPSP